MAAAASRDGVGLSTRDRSRSGGAALGRQWLRWRRERRTAALRLARSRACNHRQRDSHTAHESPLSRGATQAQPSARLRGAPPASRVPEQRRPPPGLCRRAPRLPRRRPRALRGRAPWRAPPRPEPGRRGTARLATPNGRGSRRPARVGTRRRPRPDLVRVEPQVPAQPDALRRRRPNRAPPIQRRQRDSEVVGGLSRAP
jgi:hypothetical protein